MSGGSLNYAYCKIDDCRGKMGDPELNELVKDFAELLHDREWYIDDDIGEAEWENTKNKFKSKWLRGGHEKRLKKLVEEETEKLKEDLLKMIGGK